MDLSIVKIQPLPYPAFTAETAPLKAKKMHVICEAADREAGMAMKYMTDILLIKREMAHSYINKVNAEKEAASLHPFYTFSLFPHINLSDQDISNSNLLEEYLHDLIFEANERYIKAETMVFSFEKDNTPEFNWFSNIVHQTIDHAREKAGLQLGSLKTIYISQG